MSWFDQIRRAREAQEALGHLPPEETEELLRTSYVRSGSTQAERSYRDAMLLNADLRFRALDHDLAERVLDPAETVHDVLVGEDSTEDPPLLLVTDGRVLVTTKRAFGTWHVKDEVPAPDLGRRSAALSPRGWHDAAPAGATACPPLRSSDRSSSASEGDGRQLSPRWAPGGRSRGSRSRGGAPRRPGR